jgi:hypothetical protein
MSEPHAMTGTSLTHSVHRYAASLLAEAATRPLTSMSELAELRDCLVKALHHQQQTEADTLLRMIRATDPGIRDGPTALSGKHGELASALGKLAAVPVRDRSALHETAVAVRDILHRRPKQQEPLLFPALADALRWAGAWLVAQKVRADDVLASCAPDSIEFVAARQTASWTRAAVVTLSPLSPGQEMLGQLCRSRARWLVTTSQLFQRKPKAAARMSAGIQPFLIGTSASTSARARADTGALTGAGTTPRQRVRCAQL